jgi:hypothetical protein
MFGLMGISLSMNNFSLLLFNSAFLIDTIGYTPLLLIFILTGLVLYGYQIKKQQLNKTEILLTTQKLVLFLLFLGLIHFLFFIITWYT